MLKERNGLRQNGSFLFFLLESKIFVFVRKIILPLHISRRIGGSLRDVQTARCRRKD